MEKIENVPIKEIQRGRKAHFVQFITIISAYIFLIDGGAHMVWTSPSLPYLKSENSHIPLTKEKASYLVYLISFSSIFGPFLYLITTKQLGRKNTILLLGTLQLLSWILTDIATNYELLCVAKLTFGLAYSAICSAIPVYIGEIADKKIRGTYLSLLIICSSIGAFLMAICGAFLNHKTMNLVMTVTPVFGFIFSIFMTETPYYQLMRGYEEEAVQVLMKLSAVTRRELIADDIERMKRTLLENEKTERNIVRDLFIDKGGRKAFIIVVITASFSGLSGYIAIQAFAEEILSYSNSALSAKHGTMILTGIQIFSGLTSSLLIDTWGRKPTCLLSGLLSSLSLAAVGVFYMFQYFFEFDLTFFTFAPLVGLICFTFSCNIGINPISFVYVGEIFSIHLKEYAAMTGGISFSIGVLTSNYLLHTLNAKGNIYMAFWIFSVFCILEALIVWFVMPETKGKNLEEILFLMGYRKNKRSEKNNVC